MANRGDDKLRSLLKKFEMQTPPPSFTNEVVREIEAMADERVYASARLKIMLQKNVTQLPSNEFTYKVLNNVREQSRIPYPPIIGRKTWALIAVFLVACVMVALTMEPLDDTHSVLNFLPLGKYVSNLTLHFVEPLFYSSVILVSVGSLLLLDHVISKRRSRRSG